MPLKVWAAPLTLRQVGRTSTDSPGSHTPLPAVSTLQRGREQPAEALGEDAAAAPSWAALCQATTKLPTSSEATALTPGSRWCRC